MSSAGLFDVQSELACKAFVNLRAADNEHTAGARAHCEDLWRDFAKLADPNFVTEFAQHLHERWFEMYVAVTLMRAGYKVECRKPGPDVLVTIDGRRIWIEATAATPGEEGRPDSVSPREFGKAFRTPIPEMALRVRNALSTKMAVFDGYLKKGIVAPEDLLVVAINVFEIPGLSSNMEEVMKRAFYGVGDLVVHIDKDTKTIVGSHNEQLTHIAKKSTGAEVGVQPFIDGSMGHISAVLGSRADCANLPKDLGGDFLWLPNLTAKNEWPAGSINIGEEWQFAPTKEGWDGKRIDHADK